MAPISISSPPQVTIDHYHQWLARFERVYSTLKNYPVSQDKIVGYQLYLLDAGQFNANFELSELLQLRFPLSPFIPTNRHTYIRSSDTWAMELLSNQYRQSNPAATTVWWVDSKNFWIEFERYAHSTHISELSALAKKTVESLLKNDGFLTAPLWIEIDKNTPNTTELKATFKQELILNFSEKAFEIETINTVLKPIFMAVRNNRKIEQHEQSSEVLNALEEFFPAVKQELIQKLESLMQGNSLRLMCPEVPEYLNAIIQGKEIAIIKGKDIKGKDQFEVLCKSKKSNDIIRFTCSPALKKELVSLNFDVKDLPKLLIRDKCTESIYKLVYEEVKSNNGYASTQNPPEKIKERLQWVKNFFHEANKYKYPLPNNVDSVETLQQYEKENSESFSLWLKAMILYVNKAPIPYQSYTNRIKDWFNKQIEPKIPHDLEVAFYYRENVQGIEALVICQHTEKLQNFKSVLDNLGYRMDPIKAIRIVLTRFPNLFFNIIDTNRFFVEYLQTNVASFLTEKEKEVIQKIHDQVIAIINQNIQKNLKQYTIQDLNSLIRLPMNLPDGFQVYKRLIEKWLQLIIPLNYSNNPGFLNVVIPELQDAVRSFCLACQRNNFASVVRETQRVSEVMLLFFESFQPPHSLTQTVIEQHFSPFKRQVQGISLTPYAMRAFVRVFQFLDHYPRHYSSTPLKVAVTSQSYYEWLQNLERLDENRIVVSPVQHLSEVKLDSDVFFVEIHPNNVAASKQFAYDVKTFVRNLCLNQSHKYRTLVVDVTLNALNDSEVYELIKQALPLINQGNLNLIFIQSLTKFSQLGLDKRSSGLIVMLNNNGTYWQPANAAFQRLQQEEPVDQATVRFFSYFYNNADELKKYIGMINRNTRYVYDNIMKQFDELEVLSRQYFQITMSSDPRACYIALNVNGLIAVTNRDLTLKEKKVGIFLADLLQYFIHPLCRLFHLPLTERMSIGFPLSSANAVFDSLRITIGLETKRDLDRYVDILAFVAFVLNRERNPESFFNEEFRQAYFLEKVEQFSAMTPGLQNTPYSLTYDSDNLYTTPKKCVRYLERRVKIHNSLVMIQKELPDPAVDGIRTYWITFGEQDITVPMRGQGYKFFTQLSLSTRTMTIACLTNIARPGRENSTVVSTRPRQANESDQNVGLQFDSDAKVSFESREMIGSWNIKRMYGPFLTNSVPVYFYLHHMKIFTLMGKQCVNLPIFIKQGNMLFPLLDTPIENREFFFSVGSYEPYRGSRDFKNTRLCVDFQYIPKFNSTKITVDQHKLVIEHDFICVIKSGLTIYYRFLDHTTTCFEIDYWSIKDPLLARFMRLMTAIYVKSTKNVDFGIQDQRFTHFFMNLSLEQGKEFMTKATEIVYQNRHLLNRLLENSVAPEGSQQYSCASSPIPSLGQPLITFVENRILIDKALKILTRTPTSSFKIAPLDSSQQTNPPQYEIARTRRQTDTYEPRQDSCDRKFQNDY
ncbi:MAG TPA: hypothetical protein PLV31_03795 [Gammaproteobacteria bacterium]|nr:hypothetical protein [Gammaproteobacteria bacterium]